MLDSFFMKYYKKDMERLQKRFDAEYYLESNPDVKNSGMDPLLHYIRFGKKEGRTIRRPGLDFLKKYKRIDVLTTKYTVYVAKMLQKNLIKSGYKSEIYDYSFEDYDSNTMYILVCPQFAKTFPDSYISYQLEQVCVSNRWLNEEYLKILENSYAIFDYSLENIQFLSRFESIRRNLYYVPIDVEMNDLSKSSTDQDHDYKYDILFYGDSTSERRELALNRIKEKYNIRVLDGVFGKELEDEIKKARIIVNIHYYDNSLLETTRLSEILSYGRSFIISEHSTDDSEDLRFAQYVDYFDYDNFDEMMEKIDFWTSHKNELQKRVNFNKKQLSSKKIGDVFFYLNRFFLAQDLETFDEFYKRCGDYYQLDNNRICLHLPESLDRKELFDTKNKYNFSYFPALKHREGWIGCAMSYKFIFKKALEKNYNTMIICEDDVSFPSDFQFRFDAIMNYLNKLNDWDIFSGLMADINDSYYVKKIEWADDELLVRLNRLVSTVFCVYNKSAFETMANWKLVKDKPINFNTIDRYLERSSLSYIAAYPFLVNQDNSVDSTLWGVNNEQLYDSMIYRSQNKLKELIIDYKSVFGDHLNK